MSAPQSKSWASVLGSSLPKFESRNVLEVILEKDTRGSFIVSESECFNLIRRLGLDTRPGINVEGVQICPNGKGVIYITLNENVEIGKFCKYEVLEVTSSGVRAINIRPAGKRDVVLTLKGLHPNTKDLTVLEYLSKFGKLLSTRVVHGVFADGPLKGMKNGDRSFKIEIKPSVNLGSYHIIDGQRVVLRYSGQLQTCARCLKPSPACRGRGIAKKCEAEGGEKAHFAQYIVNLWSTIGYSPNDVTEAVGSIQEDSIESTTVEFTPVKCSETPDKYSGVSIKQIPSSIDH